MAFRLVRNLQSREQAKVCVPGHSAQESDDRPGAELSDAAAVPEEEGCRQDEPPQEASQVALGLRSGFLPAHAFSQFFHFCQTPKNAPLRTFIL